MSKIKNKIYGSIGKLVNRFSNNTSQQLSDSKPVNSSIMKTGKVCRETAEEGIVLLKNNDVLPFDSNETISVFGRVQNDFFFVGYGSGGDVNAPYKVRLTDGLRNAGLCLNENLVIKYEKLCRENPVSGGFWGHWPTYYDELIISKSDISKAALESDAAVIIIGRSSGEDRENTLTKGSYFLTDDEKKLIDNVTSVFSKVVLLLNCGCIMDMSEINSYGDKISSILYVWQLGMESGNAIGNILSGNVSPSGKLTDTIAYSYNDYPCSNNFGNKLKNIYTEDIYVGYRYFETFNKSSVMYPFGFGLSYTEFSICNPVISVDKYDSNLINVNATIKNIGKRNGKETLQIYFEAPQGRLGKPARVLCGYSKTDCLMPGESQTLYITFNRSVLSSYDDEKEFSYILEKGIYTFFAGVNVRDAEEIGSICIEQNTIVERLKQVSAPTEDFKVLKSFGEARSAYVPVSTSRINLKAKILECIPESIDFTGDKGIKLTDVKNGTNTMSEFIAQLSNTELEEISRGDYVMNSNLGAKGNAGVFGGVSESLRKKGVPVITATDGPSGIRLSATASLLPIGTALACTWNPEQVEKLYAEIGKEMKILGSNVLLAPGMNIHRSPLCGRNFEYFSEDPLVTGTIASAVVKGVQSAGVSACPKHFACNNQETNRTHADSVLSERALREIYLKGFEICVKDSKPGNIMTSYNKINGVWGHYNYQLVRMILRQEWKYDGNIMTDWWMQSSKSPEFPEIRDQAYRVRSGINILMPGGSRTGRKKPDGTLLKTIKKKDGITLGEIQNNAAEILKYICEYHLQ